MRLLRYIAPLAVIAPALAAPPITSTLVLSRGERVVFRTAAPIAIVSLQGGLSPRNAPFRYEPEQYAQTIAITGLREGEATLLVEDTTERVGETVRVVVVLKPLETAYRQAAEQFTAGAGGIEPVDVHLAPPHVVIGGTAFSVAEMNRCMGAETSSSLICAARLASVAAVVGQDPLPIIRASVQIEPSSSVAATTAPQWKATLRIGDVPVVSLQSTDFTSLAGRSAAAARVLNQSLVGWMRNADSGLPFPATFTAWRNAGRYELSIQWNQAQGLQGEKLIDFVSSELPATEGAADSDRIVDWQLAVLTDTFRLHTLARPPLRTSGRGENPLQRFYNNALKLGGGELTRANCAPALARSFVSLRWSGGADPFATLLTRIPDDFQTQPR